MKFLEGQVEAAVHIDPAELDALRAEIRELRGHLQQARAEATQAKRDAARALSALRQQLTPLYRALQAVFGEIDAAGVEDVGSSGSASNPRTSAVWESWKSKLGGGAAKVIDALMVHSELNTQQLAIATGLHRTTIPKLIYQLNKAGLLTKNGGRFSLKQL